MKITIIEAAFVGLVSGCCFAEFGTAKASVGYEPIIDIDVGIRHFVEWYQDFYR